MTAIQQAWASNTQTAIPTFEFIHSAFTGGVLRVAQSKVDVTATVPGTGEVTFAKSGISFAYPSKTTEGQQDLNINLDNVSGTVYAEMRKVKAANRVGTVEKIKCVLRTYLPSDLSAPAGPVYNLTVVSTAINDRTATIRAAYAPIPNISWPRKRYYPTKFPGLKYVG